MPKYSLHHLFYFISRTISSIFQAINFIVFSFLSSRKYCSVGCPQELFGDVAHTPGDSAACIEIPPLSLGANMSYRHLLGGKQHVSLPCVQDPSVEILLGLEFGYSFQKITLNVTNLNNVSGFQLSDNRYIQKLCDILIICFNYTTTS